MAKSVILPSLLFLSLVCFACSETSNQVPKSVEDLLKPHGVQAIQLDYQYQTPDRPDLKYASFTATYSFASAEGTPQKEYLGYILKRQGQDWVIERNTKYTKEEAKAKELLLEAK